jgi:RNA polymerase-binding transcription factor DksA
MSNISARHSLLKRQSALQLRLETLEVDLHKAAGYPVKEESNGTLAITASQTACELVQIERVLDKLGRDQYGCCESCGRPIGGERLKVVPNAATCIGCAQGH